MDKIKAVLIKYIPDKAVDIIAEWIVLYKVHLNITKSRSSKSGDYRSPRAPKFIQQITVNHDLNKYAFLITLVHEIAHLKVWNKFRNLKQPHGQEWKIEFGQLLNHFIKQNIFPPELELVVKRYLINPSASSGSDEELFRTLRKYDEGKSKITILEDLPDKALFKINDGRKFIKGERLRKRYRCTCLNNKRVYLVNGLMEVVELSNDC